MQARREETQLNLMKVELPQESLISEHQLPEGKRGCSEVSKRLTRSQIALYSMKNK
jgi:hypothetical protein